MSERNTRFIDGHLAISCLKPGALLLGLDDDLECVEVSCTPEQALEAANALVEAALEIINARPAQALVATVPSSPAQA